MTTKKLCLGTVQLGMKYGVQGSAKPSMEQAIHLLNKAYEGGITSFDTASAYGDAETILGLFLRQPEINRDKIEIITKLSIGTHIERSGLSIQDQINKELTSSLTRMGVAYVDGCLFHNAKTLSDDNNFKALLRVKEQGLTKQIGVSVYTPEEAMHALLIKGLDIIQIPYNALDRRWDNSGFFTISQEKGIRVFVRSVLLQGLLPMPLQSLPPNMLFALDTLKEFHAICQLNKVTPFEAAVSFVLNHADIDHIVFGVDNVDQLDAYLNLSQKKHEALVQTFLAHWSDIDQKILRPDLWQS